MIGDEKTKTGHDRTLSGKATGASEEAPVNVVVQISGIVHRMLQLVSDELVLDLSLSLTQTSWGQTSSCLICRSP